MKVLSSLSIYRLILYFFFIEGDTRYAVVEWKDENSYVVIGLNCFLKIKEEYRLDEIYKVKWVDNSIYSSNNIIR